MTRTVSHRALLAAAVSAAAATSLAALAACSGPSAPTTSASGSPHATGTRAAATSPADAVAGKGRQNPPLTTPATLALFGTRTYAGEGQWRPVGRLVDGLPAVYETTLTPPGGSQAAGIAWMDTKLLSARLYSGSVSPGGLGYKFTAPISRDAAGTLVAAFNGGFKMSDAHGGYYTEGRTVAPLVRGAASLVIYANGSANVGAWGTDVAMARSVVAVRQNLVLLVADGKPTAQAASVNWQSWGNTCGLFSCAASVPGVDHQWRSALGVTAAGALVYAVGPALDPLQLAQLLARAGVVRGMELDINPGWPVFATYKPAAPNGVAGPSNGTKLLATRLGARTFFQVSYARDFVTLSARAAPGTSTGSR